MAKLQWDKVGERFYEAGTDQGVLYVFDAKTKAYKPGVAWNGLTAINESPSGAEPTPMFADNIKYVTITSAEEFDFTIEAFMYPEEFNECDGKAVVTQGMTANQQSRATFGLSYRTKIGNDVTQEAGFKIHLIYGALASPSAVDRSTINDSPEGVNFSWECTTTPVPVPDFKPAAHFEFDSRTLPEAKMTALLNKLYGGEADAQPTLPPIEEVIALVKTVA